MLLSCIARHSTLIMPICAIVGFVFPNLSNAVLIYLPQVLFFLMFFTLLGIDQYALLKRIATSYVWVFALLQSGGMSLALIVIAYALGVRGDWLLAIAGLGATAPLFGSGALVNAVGFDALLATAKTIAATVVMPCTLLFVLWLLGDDNARIDVGVYVNRLSVYIVMPIVLAIAVRRLVSPPILSRYYPKIAQFNILLLMLFPLGLMAGFRTTFDHNPWQALLLLVLSSVLALVFYFMAYIIYRRFGTENAIVAALVCGGRNVLLAYTITVPFMGAVFLPLLGAFQLPAFCLPLLGKYMAKRNTTRPMNLKSGF